MYISEKDTLLKGLDKLSDFSVLVIGDMALDEMVYGTTDRMSREAPVLILRHYKTNVILGAASNAAHNIAALNGGKVGVIGVTGDDYYSRVLSNTFEKAGINTEYLVRDESRPTTVKTRISGSCSQSVTQQIVRIDRELTDPVSPAVEAEIIKRMETAIPLYDAVILSDYNIGLLTDNVIKSAIEISKKHGKKIIVDSQKSLDRFKGVTSMTPNQPDSEKFVGFAIKDSESLQKAGSDILAKTDADSVLITLGGDGMALFEKNGGFTKIPVFNKTDVFDVTGAGDTVVAVFTLAAASGLPLKESAILGNLAASIVIRYFGCAVTSIDVLKKTLCEMDCEKYGIK